MNLVTMAREHVPFADWFFAGFSCTSRCRMNANRAQFVNCVQHERGETGKTFHQIARFILRSRPARATLENVINLSEHDLNDSNISDTEYIVKFFQDTEYETFVFQVDAPSHGSPAARSRLYFELVDQRRYTVDRSSFSTFVMATLRHMQLEPEGFEKFQLSPSDREWWTHAVPHPQSAKRAKESEAWVEKHVEVFHRYGLAWPRRHKFDEETTAVLSDRAQEFDCWRECLRP